MRLSNISFKSLHSANCTLFDIQHNDTTLPLIYHVALQLICINNLCWCCCLHQQKRANRDIKSIYWSRFCDLASQSGLWFNPTDSYIYPATGNHWGDAGLIHAHTVAYTAHLVALDSFTTNLSLCSDYQHPPAWPEHTISGQWLRHHWPCFISCLF